MKNRPAAQARPRPRQDPPIIAVCYDFDGTLSPRNMQEYDYIPKLRLSSRKFWRRRRRPGNRAPTRSTPTCA